MIYGFKNRFYLRSKTIFSLKHTTNEISLGRVKPALDEQN